MHRLIFGLIAVLGLVSRVRGDACVVLVADGVGSVAELREALPEEMEGRAGLLMASPEAGMRRAALLTGRDALLSGVWGRRAANLRLTESLAPVLVESGVSVALAGAWGFGAGYPCRAEDHDFEVLKSAYGGRTKSCMVSQCQALHGPAAAVWLSGLESALIYHSLDWGRGDAAELHGWVEHYRKAGIEHFVLIGGGVNCPFWWSASAPPPVQLTEVLARLERLWLNPRKPVLALDSSVEGTRHLGAWPGLKFNREQRHRGLATFNRDWVLLNGRELYRRQDYAAGKREDLLRQETAAAVPLIQMQEAWWSALEPRLRQSKAYKIGKGGGLKLGPEDWEASRKRPGSPGWPEDGPIGSRQLVQVLSEIRGPARHSLADRCGGWSLVVEEDGYYELILKMAPDPKAAGKLANCRAGELEVRIGEVRSRLKVIEGASRFRMDLKLESGPAFLEATLSQQIGDEHGLLGVFFAELKWISAQRPDNPNAAAPGKKSQLP